MTTLEDVLRYHGNPGRTQIIIWLLVLYNLFHAAMLQSFNIMIAYTPIHHCKLPPDFNWTVADYNLTSTLLYPDTCSIYNNPINQSLGKRSCDNGYEYITLKGEIYPSNEFDLVCEDSHWIENTLAISYVGVLIGGLLFGPIADRYGRKTIMCLLMLGISIFSTAIYFVNGFVAFLGVRFVLGVFNQGLQTVGVTYGSELFISRMRTLTMSVVGIMWSLTLPLQSLLFYTLEDWRVVHLLMGILSCISTVYVWLMPESVAWLLNKQKVEEAKKVLNMFARFNKIEPSVTLESDLRELAENLRERNEKSRSNRPQWTRLFTTPIVRRIFWSLLYVWFTTALILFGLSFSISVLKGNNMYVNYAIAGILAAVMRILILAVYMRHGRVKVMCPVLFFCGVCTIIGFMIWHYVPPEYNVIQIVASVIALIGRNLMMVNLTLLMIFTNELMPISLRSTGVGFGFSAARLGNVIAPYTRFLREFWLPLPQCIYGIMAIAGSLIVLTLPETFNQPLPDTLEDVQNMTKKKWNKSKEIEMNKVEGSDEEPLSNKSLIDENKVVDEIMDRKV